VQIFAPNNSQSDNIPVKLSLSTLFGIGRQHYLACIAFLDDKPGSRANSRETVAGWILNSRAASAAVLPPFETIFLISACC
jgi:hypothetical protein